MKRIGHYREESRDVFSVRLYDRNSCHAIVQSIRDLKHWSTAEVRSQAGPGEFVTSVRPETRVATILNADDVGDLYGRFDQKVDTIVKPLTRTIFGVSLREHAGTQVIRYPPGGHYVPHQDAVSDMCYRYFTVVCYLNDDFEGGQTWFPSLDYSAVPRAGRAVVFPSRFYHCAQPVIRGEKFVIVTWVNGPLPVQWI